MNDARYAPRDFSAEPSGFGHAELMKWRDDIDPADYGKLNAAKLQHIYVLRIRAALIAMGWKPKRYADRVDSSYDRLMKVFRGHSIMRLEDIGWADEVIGEISDLSRDDAAGEKEAARLVEIRAANMAGQRRGTT